MSTLEDIRGNLIQITTKTTKRIIEACDWRSRPWTWDQSPPSFWTTPAATYPDCDEEVVAQFVWRRSSVPA